MMKRKDAPARRATAPPLRRKLFAEFVGTLFGTLVPTAVDIAYYTTGHVDDVARWLARGFIVTALIYALSEISGAHIDPAVSLGFLARGLLPLRQFGLYVLAQFAGAFAASWLMRLEFGGALVLGASHPGSGVSAIQALLAEVVMTFLLMTVILATADAEFAVGKQAAVAVGLTVAACGFAGGSISGASMNPARSVAPQVLAGAFGTSWIYLIGPSLGALLAVAAAPLLLPAPGRGERKAAEGE
jgi:aquaporin Z